MSDLDDPIPTRLATFAIDYTDSDQLISRLREMADAIDGMSAAARALTYDHPDWISQRLNCCGGGGP